MSESADLAPLRLDIAGRTDLGPWNDRAARMGGNLFHTYHYAESVYGSGRGERFYAVWRDGADQPVGCCLGAIQGPRRWPLSALFRHAHLTAFPASADRGTVHGLVQSLASELARRGVMALTIDSYAAGPDTTAAPTPTEVVQRAEFSLDLSPAVDELWKGLSASRRTKVNRAKKAGLTFRRGRAATDARELGRLIASSSDRKEQLTGDPFETPGDEKLDRIGHHLIVPGLATVYLAERDGVLLAATLIGMWNGQAYYLLAGSSSEGFAISASSWLNWEIIKDLKAEGCREYNLGGVAVCGASPESPGHGLYEFKRQFGGVITPCPSPTFALRPARLSLSRRLRRVLHTLSPSRRRG